MSKNNLKPIILLLSAGSLVGQNIVQALGGRKAALHLVATNSIIDEPSLQDFDEVYLVEATSQGLNSEYAKTVIDLIDKHSPALVIPCRDADVAFLSLLAEEREDLAGTLLCGPVKLAEAMLDKWQSWLFSCENKLPFAPSEQLNNLGEIDLFVRQYGFPLITKPKSGFASKDVTLVFKHEQLTKLIGNTEMMAQKYLGHSDDVNSYLSSINESGVSLFHSFESEKHSIQVIIGLKGEVLGLFTTLHKMRNGISIEVEEDLSYDAKALGECCAEVFGSLGWVGPLNIQCQRTPEGLLEIYEFNARFTGATAARALLGFDELGIVLQKISGVDIQGLRLESATRVFRQPTSRIASNSLLRSLRADRCWSK